MPPVSIPDYLALVGDASDGYPGLRGWGAKSTAAVLARFGHLENIPADWRTWGVNATSPAALAQTLDRDAIAALLFRDLATLRTDIPTFDTVDALEWTGPRPEFAALARALRRRRQGRGRGPRPAPPAEPVAGQRIPGSGEQPDPPSAVQLNCQANGLAQQ